MRTHLIYSEDFGRPRVERFYLLEEQEDGRWLDPDTNIRVDIVDYDPAYERRMWKHYEEHLADGGEDWLKGRRRE